MGLFENKSTFRKFIDGITNVIADNPTIGDEFYDELEESLVVADIGIDTAEKIMEELRDVVNRKYITKPERIIE